MPNFLPGHQDPGLFEHPQYGPIETHLAKNRYNEGYVVRYWNESFCLPQTALYNDNAMGYLSALIKVVTADRMLQSCLNLDCYPSEFLLLRDCLDLADWSLVVAQVRPEVMAVCFAHLYHPELYHEWIAATPDYRDYGQATDPMTVQFYRLFTDDINARIAGFAKVLEKELVAGSGTDELPRTSVMHLLYRAEHEGLNLTTLFKLCQGPARDACTFIMSRMDVYQFGFLHMATFHPAELEKLQAQLGPIVNPQPPVADKPGLDRQMKITAYAMANYTDGALQELSTRKETEELEENFTDGEFNALFGLK